MLFLVRFLTIKCLEQIQYIFRTKYKIFPLDISFFNWLNVQYRFLDVWVVISLETLSRNLILIFCFDSLTNSSVFLESGLYVCGISSIMLALFSLFVICLSVIDLLFIGLYAFAGTR